MLADRNRLLDKSRNVTQLNIDNAKKTVQANQDNADSLTIALTNPAKYISHITVATAIALIALILILRR